MADLSTIEPVEVFAVGVHPTDDGPREYSGADLDQIVANFARLSDPEKSARVILEPTIVLGHEEDGDENKFWADLSTGVPSVGIVTKLWREGPKLLAQFSDVIPEVQDAIRKKMYRKVSSEIYDNFEDQGQGYGLALRRVALLGGEIPQVKQLSDILAHVKMSERKGKITRVTFFSEKFCEGCGGTCGQKDKQQNFQEAESMDRSQMLEALQAMGVDTSVIDDQTPDAVLDRVTVDVVALVVRADSPYKTYQDFTAALRANPKAMTYSSSGNYGISHFPAEMLLAATQTEARHIPYAGGAPMLTALMGGQVDFNVPVRTLALPHVQSGRLRYLAMYGAKRWSQAPEVPTLAELGVPIEFVPWTGVFAPAGTPADAVEVMRKALRAAAQDSQFTETVSKSSAGEIAYLDGAELEAFWKADLARTSVTIQRIGRVQ